MKDILKALSKLPYALAALILGVILVILPYMTVNFANIKIQNIPLLPQVIGGVLVLLSIVAFWLTQRSKPVAVDVGAGVDLTRVKQTNGGFWTTVEDCQIWVVNGRIEECPHATDTVIVLPCNEYFDDYCVRDAKSALGAYVTRMFEGQADAFIALMKDVCLKRFAPGKEQQKTDSERAVSFGPGKCLLLIKPLGHPVPIALVSTTTQRAGEGLAARISYLFDGMGELFKVMADARLSKAVMPVMGAGHGGIDTPLAFVGLLLALAEAARYGQGGQRLRKVTILVYKPASDSPAEVDPVVVERALAVIGSGG